MSSRARPVKTELCRRLLLDRHTPISRAHRSFLIMVDGQRHLGDLDAALAILGMGTADLHSLTRLGLLAWEGAPGADSDAAVAPGARSSSRVAGNRSLAAAKLFALELTGRMLARRDQPLRDAARDVTCEDELLPWLNHCALLIAELASPERAALFIDKVHAVVPRHLLEETVLL
jgi:hypothetical protein